MPEQTELKVVADQHLCEFVTEVLKQQNGQQAIVIMDQNDISLASTDKLLDTIQELVYMDADTIDPKYKEYRKMIATEVKLRAIMNRF